MFSLISQNNAQKANRLAIGCGWIGAVLMLSNLMFVLFYIDRMLVFPP